MCTDMCVDMCIDMCTDMRTHVHRNVYRRHPPTKLVMVMGLLMSVGRRLTSKKRYDETNDERDDMALSGHTTTSVDDDLGCRYKYGRGGAINTDPGAL